MLSLPNRGAPVAPLRAQLLDVCLEDVGVVDCHHTFLDEHAVVLASKQKIVV